MSVFGNVLQTNKIIGFEEVTPKKIPGVKYKAGWIEKYSSKGPVGRWTLKWGILTEITFFYFDNDKGDEQLKGYFDLSKYNEVQQSPQKGHENAFRISCSDTNIRRIILDGESPEESLAWANAFREAIRRWETLNLKNKSSNQIRNIGFLHLRIAEARKLKVKELVNISMNPYAVINIGKHSVKSRTMYKTTEPLWAEEYDLSVDSNTFYNDTMTVTVFDADEIGRDKLIGSADISMKIIAESKQNVEQWWPLVHMHSKDFVSGEVFVEVDWTSSGREYVYSITVVEARNLSVKDANGYSDPFVIVKYGENLKYKSEPVKKTLNPVWKYQCTVRVPVEHPKKDIVIEVRDWDFMSQSDFMGEVAIPVSSLIWHGKTSKWYGLTAHPSEGEKSGKHAGDIRLRLQYSELRVLHEAQYDHLWKMINTTNFSMIHALGEATHEKEEVARTLVRLFHAKGEALTLLSSLIGREIDTTSTPEVLFRGNSLATKAVDAYMRLIGTNFLKRTLGRVLQDAVDRKRSCEVDPMKLEKGETVEQNQKNLTTEISGVYHAIIASADDTPIEMRRMFAILRQKVVEKWGSKSDTYYTAPSGFIFLRFWAPAILGPKLFGLVTDHPKKIPARTLTLISKTVQTLGNLAQFGGKEPYMSFMNGFIVSNQVFLKQYIDKISTVREGVPPTQLDHVIDIEAEFALTASHITKNRGSLVNLLVGSGSSSVDLLANMNAQ